MSWINFFGLVTVIAMLIPNIFYGIKVKQTENKCKNSAINILEQVGRYGCMFLMSFNIGFIEPGFYSENSFVIFLFSIPTLLLAYWILFFVFYKKPNLILAILLAVIPSTIFILSGFLFCNWLLVLLGFCFSFAHTFVTYKNNFDG